MTDEELAMVRGLVPMAWADGSFAAKEQEMFDALLEAYGANDAEKKSFHDYARELRTLDDIDLQALSAGGRRVMLQHAVLLSYADGAQHASESRLLGALTAKLRIPDDEAKEIVAQAEARAKKNLALL